MRILLAVSGGIDSMYMLYRAPELFPGASFAVAHCNFLLRGEDSEGDEEFVRRECSALGVECFVKRFDTFEYASEHGVSIEMAARELRYAWFASLCAELRFDALATAHNANDNAETLILNLLRGTGTKGMRGIPASCYIPQGGSPETSASLHPSHFASLVGPSRSHDHGRPWFQESLPASISPEVEMQPLPGIVRPLLGVTRKEIEGWMKKNGKSWREDRTNAENGPKRNKIRNQVFPVFAEINPSFVKTLGADMERIRQTDDIAEDYYREAAERIIGLEQNGATKISVQGLLSLKHWRYVLWRALEDCSFNAETFDKLCTLLERYRTEPSGTVTLSGKTFQSPTHLLRARKKSLLIFSRRG